MNPRQCLQFFDSIASQTEGNREFQFKGHQATQVLTQVITEWEKFKEDQVARDAAIADNQPDKEV